METKIGSIINNNNYAIIEKNDDVLLCSWKLHKLDNLDELENLRQNTKRKIVFILPFCIAREEKWYNTIWEEKILAMEIEKEINITRNTLLSVIKEQELNFWEIEVNISNKDYENEVEKIKLEIQNWNINQMIFSRKFTTFFKSSNDLLLSMYKKLLQTRWQYMTFLFNTPEISFLWATPEKHVCIEKQKVIMNPIAWTLWKLDKKSFFNRLINFLENEKEIWELWMVIDEELKMMMKISNSWYIDFPLLKEIGAVIHTEWELIWDKKSDMNFMEVLRETLYAPTLTWWPIKSAFNLIAKYEQETRWYYWWAFWILAEDFLDTSIVIRSAFIDKINNTLSVRAWAWIVKDSIPENEAIETILKSKWFLWAFENDWKWNKSRYLDELSVDEKQKLNEILRIRKQKLSDFYFQSNTKESLEDERIKDKKILFLNSWDDFVFMSAYMMEKMGANVNVIYNLDFDIKNINDYDIIVLWPGYWDINDDNDERMINLLKISQYLLDNKKKVIWICLWHQAICKTLWYEVKRQEEITQWVQKEVNIFWKTKTLAFYNSFSPVINWNDNWVEIFFDDRILSLNRENISSIQAHPESIMCKEWFEILKNMVLRII